MERKKATDFPQELLNVFDRYVHGEISRRQFLDAAKKYAMGGLTAMAIWESLRPNYALAQQMAKDAVRRPNLGAAVAFYGRQPSAEDAAKIKAPLLLHYASLDTRITDGWPAYEAALKANRVTYAAYVYEGANHGFHNDTTPRYYESAAKLAWQRTVDFLNKYLRS